MLKFTWVLKILIFCSAILLTSCLVPGGKAKKGKTEQPTTTEMAVQPAGDVSPDPNVANDERLPHGLIVKSPADMDKKSSDAQNQQK